MSGVEKQKRSVQVAIVGGGIVGTSVARELSRYKLDVLLVEAEPRWGGGGALPKRTAG